MAKNIVVVGTGYWGKNYVRNLSELGVLYGISDLNAEVVGQFATQYNANVFSFDDILVDAKIDGVILATPAHLHFEQARRLIKAGKNVFVEKPITLKSEDAQVLKDLAADNDVILMVGHILRYHPVYKKLKEIVDQGRLGAIKYITSNRFSFGKFRQEEDVWWSFAPHDISMILGLLDGYPNSIQVKKKEILKNGRADIVEADLEFDNDISAKIKVSWFSPYKEHKLTVIGDKAMAVFDDTQVPEYKLSVQEISNLDTIPTRSDIEYIKYEASEPLKNECLHFMECIDTNTLPLTDAEEGLNVVKILEAA